MIMTAELEEEKNMCNLSENNEAMNIEKGRLNAIEKMINVVASKD